MKKVLLLSVFVCFKPFCFSQNINVSNNTELYYYDFHPLSTLALGKTFDPNHLGDAKLMPITFDERREDIKPDNSALFTSFDIYLVSNTDELKWAFNYDSKVSARFFKAKASSSISFLNNFEFKSNSIYLVINAKSEFSRTSIENIKFTNLAEKYVKRPKRFEEIFGSRIVTMVRKGIAVWILISIDNVSYSLLNKIRYTSSVSGKFGPIKGSAELDIKNELNYRKDKKNINIQIFTNGGKSVGTYKEIIDDLTADESDFRKIKTTIANTILKDVSINDAAPIGYHTTSIKSIGIKKGWKIKDKVISSEFENTLFVLSDLYTSIDNRVSELGGFLNGKNPKSQLLKEPDLNEIRDKFIPNLETHKNTINELHTKTLFKYDDISESDYENNRNFNSEKDFIDDIKTSIQKIKVGLENNYPSLANALKINWDGDNLVINCPKIEYMKFKIFYDMKSGSSVTLNQYDFSELCFDVTSSSGELEYCPGPATPGNFEKSSRVWGRLNKVQVKKTTIQNSINVLDNETLFNILSSSDPSTQTEFDLYLNIKSPFLGEKDILFGKVYFDRNVANRRKALKVSLFENIFFTDILSF